MQGAVSAAGCAADPSNILGWVLLLQEDELGCFLLSLMVKWPFRRKIYLGVVV